MAEQNTSTAKREQLFREKVASSPVSADFKKKDIESPDKGRL